MNTHPGIFGRKLGMTQLIKDDGNIVPCTVVLAGCIVVGKRTEEKDGYNALIVGLGEKKESRSSKAVKTAFEKVGVKTPQDVRELRSTAEAVAGYEIGQEIKVEDVFEEGQLVDVQSRSKGRGFAGVMTRYNFRGAKASHGAHEAYRHGGSIGMATSPGRVLRGKKMPGQHGNKTVSVLSQRIAKVIPEKKLILIEGSVPGARSALVRIQGAVKKRGGKK